MERVLTDDEMKKAWGERFKAERKKKYPRQEDFAEAMQREGHATTQATVGRWEHMGGTYGKEIPGFPSFPTMQSISKLLDVQIGYLIGESEAKSFDAQAVSEYLGLSEQAVESLRELAHRDGANASAFSEKYGTPTTPFASTLEKILTNDSFRRYVAHLNEIDCDINDFEESHSASSRKESALLLEWDFCNRLSIHPETSPERFDGEGRLLDDDGSRMFDPTNPEKLADDIVGMKNKMRIAKCLLIDDQMSIMRDIWPRTVEFEDGKVKLDDVSVFVTENSCTVTERD